MAGLAGVRVWMRSVDCLDRGGEQCSKVGVTHLKGTLEYGRVRGLVCLDEISHHGRRDAPEEASKCVCEKVRRSRCRPRAYSPAQTHAP